MTAGERVKVVRKSLKMNQTEFGEKIGVSAATISLIEKNLGNVTPRVLRDICNMFGISREWMLEGTGEMFAQSESFEELSIGFAELLSDYPGILAFVRLVSKHMTKQDWQRLNELFEEAGV